MALLRIKSVQRGFFGKALTIFMVLCIAFGFSCGMTYTLAENKKMAHITVNSPGDEDYIIQKTSELLEADTSYTVSYSYKLLDGEIVTGGAGLYVLLTGDDSTISSSKQGGDTWLRMSSNKRYTNRITGKYDAFDSEIINQNDATFTFTLTKDEVANMKSFYFGYMICKANIDIYLADMTLYKTNDPNKTNLFANDITSTDLKPWYRFFKSGSSLSSDIVYSDYDESLFPKEIKEESDEKTMLYCKRDIATDENCLIQRVDGLLKSNTEYTFSFKYHLIKGDFIKSGGAGIYVGLFGHDSTMSTNNMHYGNSFLRMTGSRYQSQFEKLKNFTDTDISDGIATLTFTLSDDDLENISDFYVGFYFVKQAVEFDFADIVLFESSDKDKTNLLCRGNHANSMTEWYSYNKTGSALNSLGKYVPYDDTLFPKDKGDEGGEDDEDDTEKMLHYTRSSKNEDKLVQKVNGLLKPNTEYVLELDLHFEKGSVTNGVSVGVFSDSPYGSKSVSYANKMLRVTRYGSASQYPRFEKSVSKGKHLKYYFNLSESELDSATANYVGFYFKLNGEVDFYSANMVLYESSDPLKTNLLPNGNKSSDLKTWYYDFGKANLLDNVEYLPYNSEFFKYIKKMLSFKNGANQVFFAQRFTPIVGDTYYFRFSIAASQVDDIDVRGTLDADRQRFPSGVEQTDRVDHEYYSTFTYSITVPEMVGDLPITSVIFAGIMIPSYSQGYIFDVSLWNSKDSEQLELFQNPDFSSGLDLWTWGMPIWFIPEKNGYGLTSYSADGNTLEVMNYDLGVVKNFIDKLNVDDGEWWNPSDLMTDKDPGTASLTGYFKDQNGNAISGATFYLMGNNNKKYTAVSNSKGVFYFRNFVAGYYELLLKGIDGLSVSTGYDSNFERGDNATVSVLSDTSSLLESNVDIIEETDAGTLIGTVYTPDLKTVPGIKLYLDTIGETVTDKSGKFGFAEVPVGEYQLYTVLSSGEKYVFKTVSIKKDTELNTKLKYDVSDKTSAENTNHSGKALVYVISGSAVLAAAVAIGILCFKKRRKV